MADQQHLERLRQGVSTWNAWREKHHPDFQPDLSRADLSQYNLNGANLSETYLDESKLVLTNLSGANLSGASLVRANLLSAFLNKADLSGADLLSADLSGADLSGAILLFTNLNRANLSGANLNGADLSGANLDLTALNEANFCVATVGRTIFGDLDLRVVKGLETVIHEGPSTIGTDTIERSHGQLPEAFLRGAGLSDTSIAYAHSLAQHPIEYYTCFLSYSSRDQDFTERLHADLQRQGVRCWFAPEDMKTGDKIRQRIDETIRLYDKLLLVLSQHSMASWWVEYEVETALSKERKEHRTVLFPIRLDNAVMESTTAWTTHVKNTRHIGDFEQWKDHDVYQRAFQRLLRDLKAET